MLRGAVSVCVCMCACVCGVCPSGIVPEIREQAMLMGARAAEAVREGWLPDSIHRGEESLTELILELRRRNQQQRTHELQVPRPLFLPLFFFFLKSKATYIRTAGPGTYGACVYPPPHMAHAQCMTTYLQVREEKALKQSSSQSRRGSMPGGAGGGGGSSVAAQHVTTSANQRTATSRDRRDLELRGSWGGSSGRHTPPAGRGGAGGDRDKVLRLEEELQVGEGGRGGRGGGLSVCRSV
jgi:hypothetical protein